MCFPVDSVLSCARDPSEYLTAEEALRNKHVSSVCRTFSPLLLFLEETITTLTHLNAV